MSWAALAITTEGAVVVVGDSACRTIDGQVKAAAWSPPGHTGAAVALALVCANPSDRVEIALVVVDWGKSY